MTSNAARDKQDMVELLDRMNTSSSRVLVMLIEPSAGLTLNVLGTLQILDSRTLTIQQDAKLSLTEGSGFTVPVDYLLQMTCIVIHRRDFFDHIPALSSPKKCISDLA